MANDVHQLVVHGYCAAQYFEMVPHFQSNVDTAPNPVAASTALINGFVADVEADLLACLAADTEILGYKCKRVNNGGSPEVMTPRTGAAGTVAGTSASSALSLCVILGYPHGGAWHAGKIFLPGIPEGKLAGNVIDSSLVTLVDNFIASLTSFTDSGYSFTNGIWSRKYSLFNLPIYRNLSIKPGIQRRRLLPY